MKQTSRLRSHIHLIAGVVMAVASPTWATETSNAPLQVSCETLAPLDPAAVRRHLELLAGPVLGKRAEYWSPGDFNAVRTIASSCDRYVNARNQMIRSAPWVSQMIAAEKVVRPVAAEVARVEAGIGSLRASAPWLPQCISLLEWRRDRDNWRNNSDKIFGKHLLDMSLDELGSVWEFTQACRNAMNLITKARRIRGDAGFLIADDLLYTVQKTEEAAKEIVSNHGRKRIEAMYDGRQIPLAYVSPKSRVMIGIVNRSLELDRPLSTQEVTELTKWADQAENGKESELEKVYAAAIREYVAKQLFRR